MKKRIFSDLFFYLGFPLLVWNLGRDLLGDYYAILIGMVPALIYSILDFIRNKETNVTGIFFLVLISMNFLFNLLSPNATAELWNEVYVSIISVVFYAITMLIRRPIGLYFFVDYAHAKGIPRNRSKELYRRKEHFRHFQLFTAFLMFRDICVIAGKSYLIKAYGLEGFNTIQTAMTAGKLVFTGLLVLYVIRILKSIRHQGATELQQVQ